MPQQLTAYYDIGTSNMRLFLLDAQLKLLCSAKRELGVKDVAISGSNQILRIGMKELYDELLEKADCLDRDVDSLYASGMVTSGLGLHEIPHFPAPTSAADFAQNAVTPFREDTLFHREILLISGLKSVGSDSSSCNITRGEEIEALGTLPTLEKLFPGQQVALLMPGSHTHVLHAGRGQLSGILSTFTGELFHALREETILAPVLRTESPYPDPEAVRLGMRNLQAYGFNRALYIGRAMDVFSEGTPQYRRCYCEAVISGGVITALDQCCQESWKGCDTAVIVANAYMCQLFSLLLESSRRIRRIETLPLTGERNYAVEGLREIIRLRESRV